MSEPERDQEIRRMARQVLSELIGDGNGNGGSHGNGNGAAHRESNGDGAAHSPVPQVPAPPIAAVLRPSTWNRPAAPGEIIGRPGPGAPEAARVQPSPAPPPRSAPPPRPAAPPAPTSPARTELAPAPGPAVPSAVANPGADARVEVVAIDSDEDLMQFVRGLIGRLANPRDRLAIHTGKLRFTLRSRPGSATTGAPAAPGPVTRIAKGAVTERVIREAADAGTRLVLAAGTVLTPLARERAQALGVEIERERK